jgi:hypothetical protein
MPAKMPPDRVTTHTRPLFHHYSITERFGACILLNLGKTMQLKYRLCCRSDPVSEVAASGNVTAKDGRIRSGDFVSISSVARD